MINKDQLFESMRGIDDEILERSEAKPAARRRLWKSSITAAACICLIIAATALAPTLFPGKSPAPPVADVTPPQSTPGVPDENETVSGPQRTWTVNYNDVTAVLDAARLSIPGYFTEELNEPELMAVEPGRKMEWMNYSGNAGFDGEGSLVAVYLRVTTPLPDTVVSVTISETAQVRDYILTDEPVISQCGGVEYTVYQYDMGSAGVLLEADAKINGRFFSFGMTVADNDPASLEQAKEAFRQVLECFTYYPVSYTHLLVFLRISTHFTATHGIPIASPALKSNSFKCRPQVEPVVLTSDLQSRLHACLLYTSFAFADASIDEKPPESYYQYQ